VEAEEEKKGGTHRLRAADCESKEGVFLAILVGAEA